MIVHFFKYLHSCYLLFFYIKFVNIRGEPGENGLVGLSGLPGVDGRDVSTYLPNKIVNNACFYLENT